MLIKILKQSESWLKQMVYIITGEIGAGKTTYCERLYKVMAGRCLSRPGGIISRRIKQGETMIGYDLYPLGTDAVCWPLVRRDGALPENWDETTRCGRFSFSGRAFERAGRHLLECAAKGINPVFVDEVGPVELSGSGFAPVIEQLLVMRVDLCLTVRSSCVADVIRQFQIDQWGEIPVEAPPGRGEIRCNDFPLCGQDPLQCRERATNVNKS